MPHYRNGRKAQVGDQVVGKTHSGHAVGGIVVKVHEEASSCELSVVLAGAPIYSLNAKECQHLEDLVSDGDK